MVVLLSGFLFFFVVFLLVSGLIVGGFWFFRAEFRVVCGGSSRGLGCVFVRLVLGGSW